MIKRDKMFYKFSLYGFLKNLRFFDPFIILFFREMGFSFFEIGSLFAIRDVSTNVLEIPTGIYADAFGRRRSMLMSFSSYIVSFVFFYMFPHFYAYAIAMVFFALGEAFRTGTHKALILEYLRLNNMSDRKVEYYGGTRAASQLGSAVSSLIAAALVFYSGSYRYIFIVSVIPYVLNLMNLATYPRELDGTLVKVEKGLVGEQIKTTLKEFVGIFRNLGAMKAILNSCTFSAFFKATKEYLQPVVKSFALSLPLFVAFSGVKRSAIVIGVVYFIIYLLTSYASKNSSRFADRFGDIVVAINFTYVMGALLLIGAGVFMYLNMQIVSIIFFLFFYVLHNIRRPLNVAFISDRVSHKTMASGLSVESQLTTVAMAVLSPLIGAAADAFGVGVALFIFGGAMASLSVLLRVKG
ncbi:MAG: MFS transporter [Synergistetes bacterium]|nr:MFS transporter [Synergistota bacterium]